MAWLKKNEFQRLAIEILLRFLLEIQISYHY